MKKKPDRLTNEGVEVFYKPSEDVHRTTTVLVKSMQTIKKEELQRGVSL